MQKPQLPGNEAQRLARLHQYEVLDSAPERAFDDLTRLAAHIAGVPIALVSLIDTDRQWFKSRYGLDAPQTPRDISFCGHVVADNSMLIVPDAFADPRFADNPLVTGDPHVRFYAGAPLISPDGFTLGTLCAIDHQARNLSDGQRELLTLLARQVVDQLEFRRQALQLRAQQLELAASLEKKSELASVLHSILANANLSVIECAPDGVIRLFNAAAERMLGYAASEVVGKATPAIIHDLDEVRARAQELTRELGFPVVPGFEAFVAKARLVGADERDWTYVRKDGSRFPVHLSVTPRREPGGEVVGFTGIATDISDRKRIERMQSEFVSTVSHELRTPLTSIRGALGLVAGGATGELPAEAREYVDIALANSERLVRLINDILDIEKMQSGGMQFRLRTTELRTAVGSAIVANEAFAAAHGVSIRFHSEPPAGEVLVDPDRLAQVLANLLSNAAKFSPPETQVDVSVARTDDYFRVEVRDRGAGIAAEFRERIFQRFAQADASNTRQKGGTGLGLSISKAIIERMHGRIGYESAPGGGTVFFFELPYLPPVVAGADVREGAVHVLVCEDDPDVARVLKRLLGSADFAVAVAPTLERARRLIATQRFDAILLDLLLADGDATPLIWELRSREQTRLVPIIVVSGSDRPMGQAAIMVTDVIVKPFDETRLLSALRNAVAVCDSSHPRLLHVEDDLDLQRIIRRMLPDTWKVIAADSVHAARVALEHDAFDVVLLDLTLPDGPGEALIGLVGGAQVIIFSATDASIELSQRVSSALVKSRANPADVRDCIVSLIARRRQSVACP